MAQSIQRQLEEIEVKQKELEDQGVRLERTLRGEEGGNSYCIQLVWFWFSISFWIWNEK